MCNSFELPLFGMTGMTVLSLCFYIALSSQLAESLKIYRTELHFDLQWLPYVFSTLTQALNATNLQLVITDQRILPCNSLQAKIIVLNCAFSNKWFIALDLKCKVSIIFNNSNACCVMVTFGDWISSAPTELNNAFFLLEFILPYYLFV